MPKLTKASMLLKFRLRQKSERKVKNRGLFLTTGDSQSLTKKYFIL